MLRAVTLALALSVAVPALATDPPPQVVERVDLARYAGTWYEIASFPAWFQKDCNASTATYTPRDGGGLDVLNLCRKGSVDGPAKAAQGFAKVPDPAVPAKLKVTFFWPFYGDYWILELGSDYEYAVVGSPDREYLWILAREPRLAPEVYQGIVDWLSSAGWDVSRLVRTAHLTGG